MKLHTPKLAALTAVCVLAFGIAPDYPRKIGAGAKTGHIGGDVGRPPKLGGSLPFRKDQDWRLGRTPSAVTGNRNVEHHIADAQDVLTGNARKQIGTRRRRGACAAVITPGALSHDRCPLVRAPGCGHGR